MVRIPGVTSSHAEDVLQEKLNVALKRNEHLTEVSTLMCHTCTVDVLRFQILLATGLSSAVSNVSGYRGMSDCRSRGRKFDPGPVTFFRGA